MTQIHNIKKALFAGLFIATLTVQTSCDSCSRKDANDGSSGTVYTYDENSSDTTSYNNSGTRDGVNNSTAIPASGRSTSASSSQVSTNGQNASSTANTSASANSKPEKQLTEEEITSMVENSDYGNAVDKNGNPIKSSGSAGTGSGTGTGSTGNNSKVTTRAAQRDH